VCFPHRFIRILNPDYLSMGRYVSASLKENEILMVGVNGKKNLKDLKN
jgi:hypothetical protein